MSQKNITYLIGGIIAVLVIAAIYVQRPANNEQSAQDEKNIASVASENESNESHGTEISAEEASIIVTEVPTAPYTNKAIGYTIDRPVQWYWRHYIRPQIGDTAPQVDDYLILDPKPLSGLGTEHLGLVVIEVSKDPLEAFAASVTDLGANKATIDGMPAIRYAGSLTLSEQMVRSIQYHLQKDGKTIRFIYLDRTNTGQFEGIFENLVKSFSFTK